MNRIVLGSDYKTAYLTVQKNLINILFSYVFSKYIIKSLQSNSPLQPFNFI